MKEYCSRGPFLSLVLTGILLRQVSGQTNVTEKNATLSGVAFTSPGYIEGHNYTLNTTEGYRFQTYYVNHTLKLQVVEFVLEPADKNAACLYDKVTIYNGYNSSAPVLNTLCGDIAAGTTYTTTGDTVYVEFFSDGTNTFKGFKMTVYSDGPTTTTSTTTTSTTASTSSVPAASNESSGPNYTIWIIVGCAIGGALLLILIILAACCCLKSKRPASPPSRGEPVKRVLWSRSRSSSTMVHPIEKNGIPPGEVVQTNIFDMELPVATGKANLLPPLSSKLEMTQKPAQDRENIARFV